jgi:hypothetical protein
MKTAFEAQKILPKRAVSTKCVAQMEVHKGRRHSMPKNVMGRKAKV